MKPILIIKTGSVKKEFLGVHKDFDGMILKNAGIDPSQAKIVSVFEGELLPEPHEISGAIITGSVAMVTDRELWSVYTEQWIRKASQRGTPILGICYGHQLIAQALGGKVAFHPDGFELGTVPISLKENGSKDRLLGVLPNSFLGHVIHSQTVVNLPLGAVNLAFNGYEAHHAFRFGENVWGVQFHPEFTVEFMMDILNHDGRRFKKNPEELRVVIETLKENDYGKILLKNFVDMVSAEY